MRVSCKVEYGLRALLDLALHARQGPVLSRDTAHRQGIPETYLNQLLLQMRRGGIVTSVRGPRGGHLLARPAREITMLEVVEALEGPIVVLPEGVAAPASPETEAALGMLWDDVRTIMRGHLSKVTVQQLAEHAQLQRGAYMYEI